MLAMIAAALNDRAFEVPQFKLHVIVTVIEIVVLVAGLAFYLTWVGTLLLRIAGNLEICSSTVATIDGHGDCINPGLAHINRTGGIVSGALPLLYNFSEAIIKGVTPRAPSSGEPEVARPASGTRRSRLFDAVGAKEI